MAAKKNAPVKYLVYQDKKVELSMILVNTGEVLPSVESLSKFLQLYHRLAAVVQIRCLGCKRL